MLGAQSLWDATMAHSVTKALYRSNLVVHVAGYFHVKQNLGIPEHLAHYCTAIGKSNFQFKIPPIDGDYKSCVYENLLTEIRLTFAS